MSIHIISEDVTESKENIKSDTKAQAEFSKEQRTNSFEQYETLMKSKDKIIQELQEKNTTIHHKNKQFKLENEQLKFLLSKVCQDTDKILKSDNDLELRQNLQKLQLEITSQETQIQEDMRLSQDKLHFQEQSEDTSKYDIQINLDSIYDLKKKLCKIQYFENGGKKRRQIESLNKCTVIGFQGAKNRGKTFLLNLIKGEKFPSAYYESTLGISAKVDIKPYSNKIYMDSEGIQKPVKFNWEEAYQKKNLKRDKEDSQFLHKIQEIFVQNFFDIKATEQIQQEFLLQSSEIVIIVVGMITLEDQKLISNIIDKRLTSQIIVVHNYKELKDVKYIEQYIQDSLMQQFPLRVHSPYLQLNIAGEHNKKTYIDRRYSNVHHVIFANNKSAAGDYYNEYSLEFIRQVIQLNTKQKSFCISEKFLKFLNDYLPNYIEFQNQIKQNDQLVRKEKNQNNVLQEDIISFTGNLEIKKIKDITLDIFGGINNAVNYSVVDYKQDNKLYKKIDIELPGNVSFEQKNCMVLLDEKGRTILLLIAQKHLDQNSKQFKQIIQSEDKRYYGQFFLKICISQSDEQLFQIGSIVNNQNGVYTLMFEKQNQVGLLTLYDKDD